MSSIGTLTADELPSSWRPGCPVEVESLRAVEVSHWGYDGEARQGTLIVAADVAGDLVVPQGLPALVDFWPMS
jgi:hypothetical protein